MKKINLFLLGLPFIILVANIRNIHLLLSGKITNGTVVRVEETHSRRLSRYPGTYYHSVVQYQYQDYQYEFWAQSNVVYEVGSTVKVIFFPYGKHHSKVYSFKGMFSDSTFMSIYLIVIWSGFLYVYKRKEYWD